jgi:hypothetical protein
VVRCAVASRGGDTAILYMDILFVHVLDNKFDAAGIFFVMPAEGLTRPGSLWHKEGSTHVNSHREGNMYKLAFFVPVAEAEAVKEAVFATGAGRIGDYEACCFQTRGTGQFRPLAGANPHIGRVGDLERVEELKVELVCEDRLIREAVAALKAAHPYEEPAFDVWKLETL